MFNGLLAIVAGLAVIAILTPDAPAYYHPRAGRFMQRDPAANPSQEEGRVEPPDPPNVYPSPVANPAHVLQTPWRSPGGFAGPVQYADGPSLYMYARGNPITGLDPTGLDRKANVWIHREFLAWTWVAPNVISHTWLGGLGNELWDFGPDLQWMQKNLGHTRSWLCGDHTWNTWPWRTYIYCRGEANWKGGAFAGKQGDTTTELFIEDSEARKIERGDYINTVCDCASESNVKNCLDAVRKAWDGTEYRKVRRNCIHFRDDAIRHCCLR